MLRLGFKASAEQFGANQLLKLACLAEEVGFDSVFVGEPFHLPQHAGGFAPLSFVWLGALGARTSKVLFGSSDFTSIFHYHPSVVAQAAATLANMFDDRFVLGVGLGDSVNDAAALEFNWPSFEERQSRLRESIELMRLLWTKERVSFRGKYYQTENATIYDRPALGVPIYVAADGTTTAMMAGELADGLICASGESEEWYTESLLPNFREGVNQSGRRNDSIDKMIEMKVSFDTDLAKAQNDTENWSVSAFSPEKRSPAEDSPETERPENALTPEQLASRWIISSDPEEHAEEISKYIELGFFHLVFRSPDPDQENFLRLYAEQVLPRLRARYGGLEVTKTTRLKELEVENAKLKTLLAEAALEKR